MTREQKEAFVRQLDPALTWLMENAKFERHLRRPGQSDLEYDSQVQDYDTVLDKIVEVAERLHQLAPV